MAAPVSLPRRSAWIADPRDAAADLLAIYVVLPSGAFEIVSLTEKSGDRVELRDADLRLARLAVSSRLMADGAETRASATLRADLDALIAEAR